MKESRQLHIVIILHLFCLVLFLYEFSELLSGGSKLPWDDSLEIITGTRRMTVEPFLKYFKPLEDWLNRENERNGDVIGWGTYNKGIVKAFDIT